MAPLAVATFQDVYREQVRYVFHSLRRLGAPAHELPDLTHDVFAIAFRKWSSYDPARPVKPWLFGIVYRVVLDHHRKASARQQTDAPAAEPVDHRTAESALVVQEEQNLALSILDTIDADQRAVFVMHELEEFTMPEIAEVLEVPLNTAYSRLRLARKRFDDAVQAARREEAR